MLAVARTNRFFVICNYLALPVIVHTLCCTLCMHRNSGCWPCLGRTRGPGWSSVGVIHRGGPMEGGPGGSSLGPHHTT